MPVVKYKGAHHVVSYAPEVIERRRQRDLENLLRICVISVDRIQQSFREPKSGPMPPQWKGRVKPEWAKVWKNRRAGPGEPPAVQTGNLSRSITFVREGLVAMIGTNVKYGRHHEISIKGGIGKHPWLARGVREAMKSVKLR